MSSHHQISSFSAPIQSTDPGGTLWCDMMNQGGVSDTRTTLDQKVSLEVGINLCLMLFK
uniref:Uncharacterized protein n=1 Tax=Helianthus annuus TaxID=4232 RepID=A0A251T652_HELAN